MERFRILSAVLAIAAIATVCAPLEAQASQNVSTPQPILVPNAAPRPMPFPPDSKTPGAAAPIEFRSADRMIQQDRDLAAGAESAIGERARLAGMEFGQASERGKWEFQQIVCPALPNHVFLRFTRDNGTGDVSIFSASIPRGGDGRVRIIPILRRGYSLFSPAGVNELTISAFNHIRAEEHSDKDPSWVGTGLCYAALAGAHPEAGLPEVTGMQNLSAVPPPILMIPNQPGAVISLTDLSASPRPLVWTMTFDGKGKLVGVAQSAMPQSSAKTVVVTPAEVQGRTVLVTPADATVTQTVVPQPPGKVIPPAPVEVQGTPVPQTSVDSNGKPVPEAPVDLNGKPVPQ